MKSATSSTIGVYAAGLAAGGWLLAVVAFGAALSDYSHALHPLALLGAKGMLHAAAFNWTGFVVPGLLAAISASMLRDGLPGEAHWTARIGARLLLLSGLAFAAQGWLPIDTVDIDVSGRWHATAWTLWWIAAGVGALLLAGGLARLPPWQWLAGMALGAAAVIVLTSLSPGVAWPPGLSQRGAVAAWLGLLVIAAHVSRRRSGYQP